MQRASGVHVSATFQKISRPVGRLGLGSEYWFVPVKKFPAPIDYG